MRAVLAPWWALSSPALWAACVGRAFMRCPSHDGGIRGRLRADAVTDGAATHKVGVERVTRCDEMCREWQCALPCRHAGPARQARRPARNGEKRDRRGRRVQRRHGTSLKGAAGGGTLAAGAARAGLRLAGRATSPAARPRGSYETVRRTRPTWSGRPVRASGAVRTERLRTAVFSSRICGPSGAGSSRKDGVLM